MNKQPFLLHSTSSGYNGNARYIFLDPISLLHLYLIETRNKGFNCSINISYFCFLCISFLPFLFFSPILPLIVSKHHTLWSTLDGRWRGGQKMYINDVLTPSDKQCFHPSKWPLRIYSLWQLVMKENMDDQKLGYLLLKKWIIFLSTRVSLLPFLQVNQSYVNDKTSYES